MRTRRGHGVVLPNKRTHIPARVVNIKSRLKHTKQQYIQLDKLLRIQKPKICIQRKLGGIGDVLMTTPLLKTIKTLIPNSHLIYATDMVYSKGALGDIINHVPQVDELIPFSESVGQTYDYCIDITATGLDQELPGTIPPNRIDMFADAVGVSIYADPIPIYEITSTERKEAKQEIKTKYLKNKTRKSQKLIIVHARSNDARRTWPLDNVDKLCDLLIKDPNTTVLLCDWGHTVNRWKEKERLFTLLDIPLPQIAALIEQCDLVICPDSSMLHLAGALQKKIVTIFGPIPPESRINYYANASAVTLKLSCSPCFYNPRCRNNIGNKLDCLTQITPEMVELAARKKLIDPFKTNKQIKFGKDYSSAGQDPIVLVRRNTKGIGDLLMASAGIEALKLHKDYKGKELHVAVDKSLFPVIEKNPHIDKIIDANSKINLRRYFAVIDISYPCARYETSRLRNGKLVEKSRVEIFAEAIGTRHLIKDLKPKFYLGEEDRTWAKEYLEGLKLDNRPKIAIALKSAELYRDWPEQNFSQLIEIIKEEYNVIILHHSREYFFEGVIDTCGLPLRQSAAILEQSDGLITVDSGPLHMAATFNIPTIALFGPIDYRARCKGYPNTTVVASDLDCVPCWRNKHIACKKTGLIKNYSKCLEVISANKVAQIARTKFKR